MVTVRIGNLLESTAQTLVNTVNCVGVMGKGIALQFKQHYPAMYDDYVSRCKRKEVSLGKPYLYRQLIGPWILNFPTKDHWRSVARLDRIVEGLECLLKHYKEWGITSLAVPPLGCGNGELEWRIVGPTLYRYLSRMEIPVELYAPFDTPHEELESEFLASTSRLPEKASGASEPRWIPAEWVGLVDIVRRIENEPYHWPIGRTTFQKIAYVATAEGLATGLFFERGSYGPYSPGLKALQIRLVNNGLIQESRHGQMLQIRVGPTFGDARSAYADTLGKYEALLERVADLFLRMTTLQAEITATVLFAGRSLRQTARELPSERDVLNEVLQWKQRRRPPLNTQEIALAVRNLAALGWLQARASADLPISDVEPI